MILWNYSRNDDCGTLLMMTDSVQFFGILNVTPDSFSDGGEFLDREKALKHAEKLIQDGADYIDVGGESTRPDAESIDSDQEWERVGEIVKQLLKKYPGQISLDTRNVVTAEKFLAFGGTILNDVSGFQDPAMRAIAPKFEKIILMHFPGKTVDEVHAQHIDSVEVVRENLLQRKELLVQAGVSPDSIILDPGIGFGKTMACNWELLKFAELLPNETILIGHSRKRFLGEDRFETEPNVEAGNIAIQSGASYLRVHEGEAY
jgi:dihydropteroate synthase